MTFPYFWNLELADDDHQSTTVDRTHVLLIERSSATPAAGAPNPLVTSCSQTWRENPVEHGEWTCKTIGFNQQKLGFNGIQPTDMVNLRRSLQIMIGAWGVFFQLQKSWWMPYNAMYMYIYIHTYTYIYFRVTSNWNTHVLLPSFG